MSTSLIIIISLVGVFIAYTYYNFRKMKNLPVVADNKNIKVLTDKNFAHQIKNGVILVDFWAAWCGPCKMMAPVLNDLANDLNGQGNIGKLNVEHFQTIGAQYKVRSIPTMVLYKNGVEINRFVGVKTKDFLLKEIKKAN